MQLRSSGLGAGLFAERDRPSWQEELEGLQRAIGGLPPVEILNVACGRGFLTRHLKGEVTGLDQSERALEIARERIPGARSSVATLSRAIPSPWQVPKR